MRCRYCGLALSADDPGQFHPICREEACQAPAALTSCPDADPTCPACNPTGDQ